MTTHVHIHLPTARTTDAFNEADHPRDGGKFTSGGGSGKATSTSSASSGTGLATLHAAPKKADRLKRDTQAKAQAAHLSHLDAPTATSGAEAADKASDVAHSAYMAHLTAAEAHRSGKA